RIVMSCAVAFDNRRQKIDRSPKEWIFEDAHTAEIEAGNSSIRQEKKVPRVGICLESAVMQIGNPGEAQQRADGSLTDRSRVRFARTRRLLVQEVHELVE